MALESPVTYISDLVAANPTVSDPRNEGDDHLRNIKTAVKNTFPNVTGAVTATHTELNYVDGVTSAIQTQLDAKAPLSNPTFTGTLTTAAFTVTQSSTATTVLINNTGTGGRNWSLKAFDSSGSGTLVLADETAVAQRILLSSTGNVTINAPSSGTALTVAGVSTGGDVANFQVDGAFFTQISVNNTNAGGAAYFRCVAASVTGGVYANAGISAVNFGAVSNHTANLITNNTARIAVTNAGNVTINAPSSGAALAVSGVSTSPALALTAAANGANAVTVTRNTLTYAMNVDDAGAFIHNVSSSHPQQFRTNNVLRLDLASTGAINFGTTGTQWQVDTSNRLLNPGNTQPSFHAKSAIARTTTGTFAGYTSQDHNQGSMLNTTSGVATAPVAGRYMVCFSGGATVSSGTGTAFVLAYKNGSAGNWNGVPVNIPNSSYSQGFSQSMIVNLAANDTVEIVLSTISGTSAEVSLTQFSMHLMG